jgi:hypothetical protein
MVRGRAEADDGVLGEEARRLQQHPRLRGLTPREASRFLGRNIYQLVMLLG